PLVENWKLDGDAGPLGDGGRGAGDVLAVFVVVIHQPVTMQAIDCQDDEYDEVRDHHHQVEGVGVINTREGSVGELVPVVVGGVLSDQNQPERYAEGHECPAYFTGFAERAP